MAINNDEMEDFLSMALSQVKGGAELIFMDNKFVEGSSYAVIPKYLQWKYELMNMTLMNRQMMKIHTIFIALVVLLMGVLCFTYSDELIETELGKIISSGLAFFWSIRLFIQFFGLLS